MANITMKDNRSSKGNIVIADDDNGIDILDSGIGLITDGLGNEFLSNDGTYKQVTGSGAPEKQSSYLVSFNSADGYIQPLLAGSSFISSLSLLSSSPSGNPVISTPPSGWVLEPGDYLIDLNIFVVWDDLVGRLVNQDQIHIIVNGLDLSAPPSVSPVIITVPYQGEITNNIKLFHRVTFPIPGIGASNSVSIEIYYSDVGGFTADFYLLEAGDPGLIKSSVTFTKVNSP